MQIFFQIHHTSAIHSLNILTHSLSILFLWRFAQRGVLGDKDFNRIGHGSHTW